MPKSIYVQFLLEQPNSNPHHLNRLVKVLNHFISIEPDNKPKGFESHHIVPKSWKPEWKKVKDNLLKVPVKAHYVIHHLMWKAFPKDYAMIEAFQQMRTRLDEKISSKVFEILRIKSNATRSKIAKERVANGSHHFLGPEVNNKRLTNGTHLFLDSGFKRKNNLERVANGSHPFLGGTIQKKTQAKRVAAGIHNFLGLENNMKRIANGTHPSQIKKTCPHCGKTCSAPMYGRWHGNRCKSLFEE